MMTNAASNFWGSVLHALCGMHDDAALLYYKAGVPHPRAAGAVPSLGLPRGQLTDWRFRPEHPCHGLHIQEYADRWEGRLDRPSRGTASMTYVHGNAEAARLATGAAFGALIGLAVSERDHGEGALVGAGFGFLLALALMPGPRS